MVKKGTDVALLAFCTAIFWMVFPVAIFALDELNGFDVGHRSGVKLFSYLFLSNLELFLLE